MADSDLEVGEKDPLVSHESSGPRSVTKPPHIYASKDKKRKPDENFSETRKKVKPTSKTEKKENAKLTIDQQKMGEAKKNRINSRNDDEPSTITCSVFGVKNYLHQFYEKPDVTNMSIYEHAPVTPQEIHDAHESIFLVKRKEGLCSSSVFRLSLMLGGLILMMGTTALIVAACASRRATLVGKVGGVAVVDQVAAAHNAEVDALFLVALIALTLGATVIAAALITRAFCRKPEFEDFYGFREGVIASYDSHYDHGPFFYSSDRKVPVTEELTQIQPWIKEHSCLHYQ